MHCPPATPTEDELRRQSAQLRVIALRLVADESTADDLAQEAWLELRRISPGHVRDLPAFMAGVLRKLSLRRHRSESRRHDRERAVARTETVPASSDLSALLESQRLLIGELQALPETLRVPLLLRYYEDRSAAEIALQCNLPASTIRSRIARGLAQLRESLDRRHAGKREAWALALLRIPSTPPTATGPTLVGSTAKLVGTIVMSSTLKMGAALALITLAGTWLWNKSSNEVAIAQVAMAGVQRLALPEESLAGNAPELESEGVGRVPLEQVPSVATNDVLNLRVIDRESGRVAPFYCVRLSAEARDELVVETNAKGLAQLPSPWFEADFELLAVDHPDYALENPSRRRVSPDQRPTADGTLDFEVELGPAYEFILPRGAPVEQLRGFLGAKGFEPQFDPSFVLGTPLREGRHPWMRFAPHLAQRSKLGNGPWFLRLRDRVGHWQGWAEVRTLRGIHPGLLHLEGGAFGSLELHVSVEGEVHASNIDFTLQSTEARENWNQFMRVGWIAGLGGWRAGAQSLAYLPAGPYKIDLRARGVLASSHEFSIEAGETAALSFDLEAQLANRTLDVRVTSESGRLQFGYISVYATQQGASGEVVRAEHIQVDEQSSSLFRFDDLSPGSWKVELQGVRHLPEFDHPDGLVVDRDVGELLFTCLDFGIAPLTPQLVEVVDADSGQGLAGAATLWVEGEPFLSVGFSGGQLDLPAMAPGVGFDWVVIVPGYRPRFMPDDSFPTSVSISPSSREATVARVVLEPGWGCMIAAKLLEPGQGLVRQLAPIAGVAVELDGVPAGRTDELGRLLLVA
ncbi:MAG: RNA polymerase sigma factor (sigma-70 family), partial [Candidatus Paceibacteria bacterium]